jgi:predicted transposase/invertase (TIGR01784 family)
MTTEDNTHDQDSPAHPHEAWTNDERIQSPHDRLINQTLQQIDAARGLLSRHLPREIAEHLQFQSLEPVDTSFIDANLRRRFADRLFKVDVSPETVERLGMKVHYVYIFVLIDHKSTDEPHTLIQMLGYLVRIWENAITNHQPLVPILPWVLYNGVGPWKASRSLSELIPVPAAWQRYLPAMELAILDVGRLDDDKMAGEPILRVALSLLKYGRSSNLESVLRHLFEFLARVIPPQRARDVLDTIRVYVMSVSPVVGEEKMKDLLSEFWPVQPEPGSVADQLIKKGEARGIAIGEAIGEVRQGVKREAKREARQEAKRRVRLGKNGIPSECSNRSSASRNHPTPSSPTRMPPSCKR